MTKKTMPSRYGQWALVTGASDGIGRALSVSLAEEGFRLILVARRGDRLKTLAGELRERFSTESLLIEQDLARPESIKEIVAGCQDKDVGLLVASAGFGTSGPFIEGVLEDELTMLDVNCRAVAALCHHFGNRFAAQRRGGIILLSSLVAFQGVPRAANYAATKAYIQSLAEALSIELAPFGVDVLSCAPGPIHSGFAGRAKMTMGMGQTPELVAKKTVKALGRSSIVRPGWLSVALEWSLSLLPRWGRVRVMKVVMGGMTKSP